MWQPLALFLLLAALTNASNGGLSGSTRVGPALEEVAHMFRSLLPLVVAPPHYPQHQTTQLFWKTDRLALKSKMQVPSSIEEDEYAAANEASSRVFPWRVQIDFRKRGPDCMRKCIRQGRLHPVQCHSLC